MKEKSKINRLIKHQTIEDSHGVLQTKTVGYSVYNTDVTLYPGVVIGRYEGIYVSKNDQKNCYTRYIHQELYIQGTPYDQLSPGQHHGQIVNW